MEQNSSSKCDSTSAGQYFHQQSRNSNDQHHIHKSSFVASSGPLEPSPHLFI